MPRLIFLLGVAALCLIPGCVADPALVAGVKSGWDTIGPRYVEYVQGDPRLANRPDIKADWLKTAELMTEAVRRLSLRGDVPAIPATTPTTTPTTTTTVN